MAHDQRVIVRRDRAGNIRRVVTILTPAAPATPSVNPAAKAPLAPKKPLMEEVSADQLPQLLRELDQAKPKR